MKSDLKAILPILLMSLVPTLLLWAPFFLILTSFWKIPLPADGMATVVANYDGPLYILVAKSFYDTSKLTEIETNLPPNYFAAHFPLFPLIIRTFAFVTGYPYGLLIATILGSILATYFFYKFIGEFVSKENALWLTFVFCLLPARYLIVRSVGSGEPLFIAAILASVYYFHKKKFLSAGVWGAVAQLTKSPGILIFIAYFLYLMFPKIKRAAISAKAFLTLGHLKKYYGLTLIPLALLGLFAFYKLRMNDFFAYFHSGDNIHLFFPPFQVFNYQAPWVGTFWLEDVVFTYLIIGLGIAQLIKKRLYLLAWVAGIYFFSLLFVAHRDILRYALPVIPFMIAGYADTLITKEFRVVMFFLLIPIYLFSLGFIAQNTMPISNWAPFL